MSTHHRTGGGVGRTVRAVEHGEIRALRLVRTGEAPSAQPSTTWRREAIAAGDAAIALSRIANELPDDSALRETLLDAASDYGLIASMRGEAVPRRRLALAEVPA